MSHTLKIGVSDPDTTTLFFVDKKNPPILFALIVPKMVESWDSDITVLQYGDFEFQSMTLDEVSQTYFKDERPDYLYDIIADIRPEHILPRPANDARGARPR